MKNHHMLGRFLFAWAGLKASFRSERSFRAHVAVFVFVLALLLWTHPAPIWWAVLLLAVAGMMAVELINTAVEKLVDHLHPDQHSVIGVVKDTLAGAVFIMCAAGAAVLVAFIWAM